MHLYTIDNYVLVLFRSYLLSPALWRWQQTYNAEDIGLSLRNIAAIVIITYVIVN
jgi:uncharacterized membrane protein YidH (DUF202 family)